MYFRTEYYYMNVHDSEALFFRRAHSILSKEGRLHNTTMTKDLVHGNNIQYFK